MPETNADTETNKNPKVDRIRKRDGRVVDFNKKKIEDAIYAAMKEAGEEDRELAEDLADQTTGKIAEKFTEKDEIPEVEDIQDQVEATLIENNLTKTAKSYILYRSRRAEIRETKKDLLPEELSVEDKLIKEMGINSLKVLEERYLLKDKDGNLKETPRGMLKRVAEDIAKAEENYGGDPEKWEEEFFEMMENLDFLPNSPTLMNAGAPLQQLAACFVLPVEDDLEQIYDSVKNAALVHQSGGGTGFSFSRLRPKGDVVKSTNGVASGPVSFMKVFDSSTEIIKQGGKRRGANMGVLRVDHPDILRFITAKSQKQELQNFNISVALTEKFMDKVEKGETYDLINPRNDEVANRLNAEKVFDLIATLAWNSGDPGIIFLDRINEENPTPDAGDIESTNPCGEQPLLPYEACNLGSIKLCNHVKENEDGEAEIDWEKLRETTHKAIRFLDNVIDRSEYPLEKIAEKVKRNRKVGLGVMGFAEMLVKLGIKYDSEEGVETGRKVMKFINEEAKKASTELAEERGTFPGYETSVYGQDPEEPELRNATRTTIAPTGTISIIANCTGGIEPMFAINYIRNVLDNTRLIETNDLFEKEARQRGIYSQELMAEVAKKGGCQDMDKVPEDMKQKYRTAHDINPKWHVKMQAAFQDHVNNAVSKTINFPKDASIEDFKEAYKLAYKEGCKGLTVYRYGSISDQPMNIDEIETEAETAGEYVESKVQEFKTYEEEQKRKTKREKRRNKGKMDPEELEGAFEVDRQFSPDCPDGTCKI